MLKIISNTGTILGRYYANQRLKAIEYLKEVNRRNTYKIMDLYYEGNYHKQMSFDTFLETFSLEPEFKKKRPYSLMD